MPTKDSPHPFPDIQPAPPLTQLHAVPSGPVAVTQSRAQRCPPLPVRSRSRHQASPQLLCSGLNNPRDFSCCSHTVLSRPSTIISVLLWMLSNSFMSLSYRGSKPAPNAGGEVTKHRAEWDNLFPCSVAALGLMYPRAGLALLAARAHLLARIQPTISWNAQIPFCRAALLPLVPYSVHISRG